MTTHYRITDAVLQCIKDNPGITKREIALLTKLSNDSVHTALQSKRVKSQVVMILSKTNRPQVNVGHYTIKED